MAEDKLVKILFRAYSDILEEITVETLWATAIAEGKGLYQLDNIPFYLPLIATDDIIHAEFDEDEEMLIYRKTVKYSGNSTIHVIVLDDVNDINDIRDIFDDMGCPSECCNNKFFAMEVPAAIDYLFIKRKLDDLAKEDIIDYAESSLSENHQQTNYMYR